MRTGLYSRLAIEGMRKNKRLYLPYLVTCVMVTTMFYVLTFLAQDRLLASMPGGGTTAIIMMLGSFVMAVFAVIFLFYTQSFLVRRRKKEFGLYNVLGMNKQGLGKILLRETVMTGILTLVLGLGAGIALSKMAELGLMRFIRSGVDYDFEVPFSAVKYTVILVVVVFALMYLNSMRQIRFAGAMDLVKSENAGEKPPKGNAILGLAGLIILAGAYGIALHVEQPIEALSWFFIAVIMVIIATYLILISGSVVVCRIFKSRKNFYYKPKNFVAVSSMAYRMKRNGAGLASICILLTMILVMVSSSSCLYIGADDMLDAQYPRDICSYASSYGFENDSDNRYAYYEEAMNGIVDEACAAKGVERTCERHYSEYSVTGYMRDSFVDLSVNPKDEIGGIDFGKVCEVHIIDIDDYNRIYGTDYKLNDGEAIIRAVKTKAVKEKFRLGDREFKVVKMLEKNELDLDGSSEAAITSAVFLLVDDRDSVAEKYSELMDNSDSPALFWMWHNEFDTDLNGEEKAALTEDILSGIRDEGKGINVSRTRSESNEDNRSDFYGTFGGLFFLGILLSIMFMGAAVLIIYYKQISEGYEDQARFTIMKKVGMTSQDIRRSINSQMLIVFFVPIIMAGIHMAFAFPVVDKLLMVFGLFNTGLLIATTAVTVLIFAVIYLIVYRITSNTYYNIVNTADN